MTTKATPHATRMGVWNVLAIISCTAMLLWIASDFLGGMFVLFVMLWYLVIPCILLYLVSAIELLYALLRYGWRVNIIKVLAHGAVILLIVVVYLCSSELFKSKIVLRATLYDDLFHYTLVFRENGTVDNRIDGVFGYAETMHGNYRMDGDTILFTKVPYDKPGFITPKALLDKKQGAVFMEGMNSGFDTTKSFASWFQIEQ
jgi:hypothetical protein